jgi:hypothetical protein
MLSQELNGAIPDGIFFLKDFMVCTLHFHESAIPSEMTKLNLFIWTNSRVELRLQEKNWLREFFSDELNSSHPLEGFGHPSDSRTTKCKIFFHKEILIHFYANFGMTELTGEYSIVCRNVRTAIAAPIEWAIR